MLLLSLYWIITGYTNTVKDGKLETCIYSEPGLARTGASRVCNRAAIRAKIYAPTELLAAIGHLY